MGGRCGGCRRHVVMHLMMHMVVMMVVNVVMMMVVVVMMLHRRGGHRRGGGSFLRDGIAGKANRQSGGGDKALDHVGKSLSRRPHSAFAQNTVGLRLNAR